MNGAETTILAHGGEKINMIASTGKHNTVSTDAGNTITASMGVRHYETSEVTGGL